MYVIIHQHRKLLEYPVQIVTHSC